MRAFNVHDGIEAVVRKGQSHGVTLTESQPVDAPMHTVTEGNGLMGKIATHSFGRAEITVNMGRSTATSAPGIEHARAVQRYLAGHGMI